jgi:hypothetical protein
LYLPGSKGASVACDLTLDPSPEGEGGRIAEVHPAPFPAILFAEVPLLLQEKGRG